MAGIEDLIVAIDRLTDKLAELVEIQADAHGVLTREQVRRHRASLAEDG